MSDEQAVLSERRDRVLEITINRPDQRNAVNAAVAEGISAALDELDGDADLSVGVITGAGADADAQAAKSVRSGSRSPRSTARSTSTQPIPRASASTRACGLTS